MADNLINLGFNFNKPNIPELEALEIGISIQTKDLTVIYENKKMQEITGGFSYKKCFERWEHLPDYTGTPCKECTIGVSIVDGKEYSVLTQKISQDGQKLLLEVNHVPLFNKEGEMEILIETYKNVTNEEKYLTKAKNINQNYNLAFIKFGDFGGEFVVSDNKLNLKIEDLQTFYTRMGIFWFTAIGQGHQWISSLFGPLPVLDFYDFVSLAFSFKLQDKNLRDQRSKGEDLILLIFIIHRDAISNFEKRNQIVNEISTVVSTLENVDDLTEAVLGELRTKIDKIIE